MPARTTNMRFLSFGILVIHFYMFYACEKYSFVKEDDVELKDHVITTMTTPYVEICWDKCVWIMNCFSINVRNTSFGMVECDLNKSSKKASPGSLVPTQGSQYHQMTDINSCDNAECKIKEKLPDEWYRFGSSSIKVFSENKTWTDARAHCQSLGGDLVSIATAFKNYFVSDLLAKMMSFEAPNKGNDLPGLVKYWPLDGSDADVNLTGDAFAPRYQIIDGENALYFPGFKGYAEIPAGVFNPEGYTYMIWVKPANQSEDGDTIYSDWYHPHTFALTIHRRFKSLFCLLQSDIDGFRQTSYASMSMVEWTHLAFSWNKTEKKVKITLNGRQMISTVISDLRQTIHTTFLLATRGDDLPSLSNGYRAFHGHLKHLMIFSKTLNFEEIQTAMHNREQGPWIGLSAQDNTNTFKWSDGTNTQFLALPSYQPSPSLSGRKCALFGRNGKWFDKFCQEFKPYICQKPLR